MAFPFSNFENELIEQDSVKQYTIDIRSGELKDIKGLQLSDADPFVRKEVQMDRLFSNESINFDTKLFDLLERKTYRPEVQPSNIFIKPWKNVDNISSRIIETYDDIVKMECLVDKENEEYEEREFQASFFHGYKLDIGSLFLIRIFERPNEMRMEIHYDPSLKNDFPEFSFVDNFKNSSLFKKR